MAWWRHMQSRVNVSSGNGLLPDGTKPLPEPVLTYHQMSSVAFTWEQFHKRSMNFIHNLMFGDYTFKIILPSDQCVKLCLWEVRRWTTLALVSMLLAYLSSHSNNPLYHEGYVTTTPTGQFHYIYPHIISIEPKWSNQERFPDIVEIWRLHHKR